MGHSYRVAKFHVLFDVTREKFLRHNTGQRRLSPKDLRISSLRLVALMSSSKNGSEERCGFCPASQSHRSDIPALTLSSTRSGSVDVRRCVDQRSATNSFYPSSWGATAGQTRINSHSKNDSNSSWFGAIGWTHVSLSVLLDWSCANRDLYFVYANQPALTICGQSAIILHLDESIRPLYVVLFAQDRVLSSWLPLPDEYACSDGSDYELVASVASGRVTIEIDISIGPAGNSCRALCVAEECDLDLQSQKKMNYEINANRSLTVKYKVRSSALRCDSHAYSGFAMRLGWPDPKELFLTKYERYAASRANVVVHSTTDQNISLAPQHTKTLSTAYSGVLSVTTSVIDERYSAFHAEANVSVRNATVDAISLAPQGTTVLSSADSGVITIVTSAVTALTVLATASVFVARWIARRARRQSVDHFKTKSANPAAIEDKIRSQDTACLDNSLLKVSCRPVSSALRNHQSTGTSARQADGSAEPAEWGRPTSGPYAEIRDYEAPSSNILLLTAISSLGFLLHGKEESSVENTPSRARQSTTEPSRCSSPGNGSPYNSLDEHVYSELDGPEAPYTQVATSTDNSLYSGLL